MTSIIYIYVAFGLIFLYIFITGFHDEGNLIATVIASRSLKPVLIFLLAFLSQFTGVLFLGTKVAKSTIFGLFNIKILQFHSAEIPIMVCAAVLGAIVWNLITWVVRIPSSSSHAIIGGLMGPFVMKYGFSAINGKGIVLSVLMPLFTSPIMGFIIGYWLFSLSQRFLNGCSTRVKKPLQKLQIVTCTLTNAFQGSNDAQKGMGIFGLLIMAQTGNDDFSLPSYIIFFSALIIALGLLIGGSRMIKSVGTKIYNVKALHSMSAQVSSLAVVVVASTLGFPVSGTQIVNSAIFGVGVADGPNAVGWLYAKDMLTAWLITIPASFALSSLFYWIIHLIGV